MSKPDGGYAFAVARMDPDGGVAVLRGGLTLRDYFAGQALVGLLAAKNSGFVDINAAGAYEVADAMIAERAK